jgi:hypothetical protein
LKHGAGIEEMRPRGGGGLGGEAIERGERAHGGQGALEERLVGRERVDVGGGDEGQALLAGQLSQGAVGSGGVPAGGGPGGGKLDVEPVAKGLAQLGKPAGSGAGGAGKEATMSEAGVATGQAEESASIGDEGFKGEAVGGAAVRVGLQSGAEAAEGRPAGQIQGEEHKLTGARIELTGGWRNGKLEAKDGADAFGPAGFVELDGADEGVRVGQG